MLKKIGSVLSAMLIAGGLILMQTAPAAATSSERRIVYTNGLDGHAISIKPDGSDRRDYGQGFVPKLSPDGTKIAFTRDGTDPSTRDLYVVHVDGTGLHKVSERVSSMGSPAFYFTWSPDSNSLAFTTEYGGTSSAGGEFKQIATVRADGTSQVQLTNDPAGISNINPVWSPDGTRILYTRTSDVNDLYIMNVDGSNQHVVAHGANEGLWSPDAKKILFYEIGVGRRVADDTGANRVTLAVVSASAAWSPDGSRVVLESPECDCSMTPSDIITVNPDGTGKTVIARPPTAGGVGSPAWSPDSSKIIFTEFARWEPSRLVLAPVNGGDKTVVIIESAGQPSWAYTPYKQPPTPPPAEPQPQQWDFNLNLQGDVKAHIEASVQAHIEGYISIITNNFNWQKWF